jgi:inosine/xanthosine triphosphate pyrophosphatase family protein
MAKAKRKIVLASRNEDKVEELRQLCHDLPFEVGSARDYPGLPDVIEDGTTEVGNASRKALVTAAYTGEISLADDTSFQVPALNNLPDIFASRFAGPEASYADNANLVLELLRDVPDEFRQARFVTAVVWVDPQPSRGLATEFQVKSPAQSRWLHNPFARPIHLKFKPEEGEYFNLLVDRRVVWARYQAFLQAVNVTHGTDPEKLAQIANRLLEPFLAGGRPLGSDPEAVWLPDSRIWTTTGPADPADPDFEPPLTVVTPTGLPTDAPGRLGNEAIWFEVATEGRLLGEITQQPLGLNGFGYDPIFRVTGSDRTLAQLSAEEKNAISHRGRALARLLSAIQTGYLEKVS